MGRGCPGIWGGVSEHRRGSWGRSQPPLVPSPGLLSPGRAGLRFPRAPPGRPPLKTGSDARGGSMLLYLGLGSRGGWAGVSPSPSMLQRGQEGSDLHRLQPHSPRVRPGRPAGSGGPWGGKGGGEDPQDPSPNCPDPQDPSPNSPVPEGVFQSRRDTSCRGTSPPSAISRSELMLKVEKRVWGRGGAVRDPQRDPKNPERPKMGLRPPE